MYCVEQVITEVDKLQTGLEVAEAKLKNTSSEKRMTSEEMEALRQVRQCLNLYLNLYVVLAEVHTQK